MDLIAQAQIKGVQSEFVDALGKLRVTDPVALKSILDALPEKPVYRFVTGPVVMRALRHARTELADIGAPPLAWKITAGGTVIAQGETREPVIAWPADLPFGYHRLTLTDARGVSEDVPMIVAPERAFGGEFDRGWLLAVQLYSIRSDRNWGIGDFHRSWLASSGSPSNSAPMASGSIRCMCCSTIIRPIAARIRRTAGCFSTHSISTSRRSRNFPPTSCPDAAAICCAAARRRLAFPMPIWRR